MPRSRFVPPHCLTAPVWIGCLLVGMLTVEGCSGAPTPRLPSPGELPAINVPVVYVPGSTGTELRERATKTVVWGRGRQFLLPRDSGYAMARPIHLSPTSAESPFEATTAIEKISLAGIFGQEVYGPILRSLEDKGYLRGDLKNPQAGQTAFLFAYDWQLDHRLGAVRLVERLEALRQARGEERLLVDLICQSNGAYICRYLVKYGAATLEQAEAGTARPPEHLDVRKMILLGNSNGGSLRMLREIHRGRTYINVVGRKLRPEVLFSIPAAFQDLPVVREDLFVDVNGQPLDIDLFDAETWRQYGWAIFAPAARQRLARRNREDLFGNEEQQMTYLRGALDSAKRLHSVLARDARGFGATRYFLLQSKSRETPDRAVLIAEKEGWEILFTGDKKLKRMPELHELVTAEGDGHGSVDSQLWLSPQEKLALAAEPFYIDDDHFELILRPEIHRRMLDILDHGTRSPEIH